MTRSNSCIYLLPLFSFYNTNSNSLFESMTGEDTSLLYTILYENYIEVFDELKESCTLIYFLDKNDIDNIPDEIDKKLNNISSIDTSILNKEIKNLNDKYFKNFHNNLLIFSHSIGVSASDIKKIFSLLDIEDESILLGRGIEEKIALFGFNSYNEEILGNLTEDRNHYDEMLIKASKQENFVHTLSNFMLIESKEDFVKLYSELSKKESLQYCNQNIHEKFTHLFIEYKDLLK